MSYNPRELADYLAQLKPGDPVMVSASGGRRHYLQQVERLTKTQVVMAPPRSGGEGNRFRLSNGRMVGDSGGWDSDTIVTPRVADLIAAQVRADRDRRLLARLIEGLGLERGCSREQLLAGLERARELVDRVVPPPAEEGE
jgi:hypothetical protein